MRKIISITIDEALHEKLKLIAEEEHRSLSNLIEAILTKAIKDKS